MNISGSQFVHGSHSVSAPHSAVKSQQTLASQKLMSKYDTDKITLSHAAQQAQTARETGSDEVRYDLVNRIRFEIAAGTYDTDEKMDAALEKMLVGIGD
ncbi:MAG: flagellar biosynthesis anti-sigma factor FlgM [Planctomycetaceae bacterium]|jgi:negative regulator of flagellin synthesis FlgM|nr:flagellar biosynthesis anti-sigma factor FlgM [Planctomycetaceae bacterium]